MHFKTRKNFLRTLERLVIIIAFQLEEDLNAVFSLTLFLFSELADKQLELNSFLQISVLRRLEGLVCTFLF